MNQEDILNRFNALPPEGRQQVLDFIAALQAHYERFRLPEKKEAEKLEEEGFLGIWKDRDDMRDSTAWVRDIRERQWVKQGD